MTRRINGMRRPFSWASPLTLAVDAQTEASKSFGLTAIPVPFQYCFPITWQKQTVRGFVTASRAIWPCPLPWNRDGPAASSKWTTVALRMFPALLAVADRPPYLTPSTSSLAIEVHESLDRLMIKTLARSLNPIPLELLPGLPVAVRPTFESTPRSWPANLAATAQKSSSKWTVRTLHRMDSTITSGRAVVKHAS